jgi:mono/diheme cytochrome c family protein
VFATIMIAASGPLGCCQKGSEGTDLVDDSDHQRVERAVSFLDGGQLIASATAAELFAKLETYDMEVFDPYEQTRVTFEALSLERALDQAYGPSWRKHDAIVFTCRDGYAPTIPVQRVLDHRAFLAFDRRGQVGFTVLKDEESTKKRIDLAPLYLIWDNVDDAGLIAEGDYGWPYQIVQIDLVSLRERFAEMAPPEDATPEAVAGFTAFVIHCSKCHAMNGKGGDLGPELNYPANPTEYMKRPWLRKWIDDPKSMRLAPRMPPLNPDLPDRERAIDEIVAYLEVMVSRKIEPDAP